MPAEDSMNLNDLKQNIAVLFSTNSRQRYIEEALERGAIYEFVDAWGKKKRWLKDEYAYLAPTTASAVLSSTSTLATTSSTGKQITPFLNDKLRKLINRLEFTTWT